MKVLEEELIGSFKKCEIKQEIMETLGRRIFGGYLSNIHFPILSTFTMVLTKKGGRNFFRRTGSREKRINSKRVSNNREK